MLEVTAWDTQTMYIFLFILPLCYNLTTLLFES